MDNCQNCGAALPTDGGGRFCPHCGEAIRHGELGMSQTHQAVPTAARATVPGDARSSYGSLADSSAPSGYAPGYEPTRAFPVGEAMGSSYDSLAGSAGPTGPTGPAGPSGPSDPVGYGPQSGPAFEATQAIPATGGAPGGPGFGPAPQPGEGGPHGSAPGEDPFEAYFRPAPGEPSPHTTTQVMSAIPQQPAYDQPIHYQGGPGQPYQEPYDGSYADEYDGGPDDARNDGRNTKIGIAVAVVAVLVIIVSLITLGGGNNSPAAQPSLGPTTVVQPTAGAPTSSDQQPSSSAPPTTSSSSSAPQIPGALQMGSTGAEVKWLQNRLKQLHFYNGPISGTFDQATAAAVQAFQAQARTSDPASVVGRSTKTALIAWGSKPAMSLLGAGGLGGDHHHGASSGDVKRLQQALSVALGQNVPASGRYDMTTATAVASYESAVGILPDGAVNDQVWSALQSGKLAN